MNKIDNQFGAPILTYSESCIEITFPCYFRDESWANSFGKVQHQIRLPKSKEQIKKYSKVVFNFKLCRWIDPLPLMSILLEIYYIRLLGFSVDILLPEVDFITTNLPEREPYHQSPNRFLLFLAQEGFFDVIENLQDKGISFLNLTNNDWKSYRNLPTLPSYINAHCAVDPMLRTIF